MRKPAFSFREIQARIGCAIAQDDWRFYLSVPLWLKVLCQCTALCFAWSKTSKAGLLMTWLTLRGLSEKFVDTLSTTVQEQ